MNKLLIPFVLIITFIISGCNSKDVKLEKPADFNFILNYGVDGKNQIDTFNDIFTWDMVTVPPVSTKLVLTGTEMDAIYIKMQEIDIFNYPSNFYEESNAFTTPFNTYKFKIVCNGMTKEITWLDQRSSGSREAKQLRELIRQIVSTIENKREYKKLPSPVGGYD